MTKVEVFENLMLPLKAKLGEESWNFLMSRGEKFIEQMEQALRQTDVSCRLWEVKYHSSYAVWYHETASFLANTRDEALDKFWANKNKESYEVMSVSLVNGS